MKPVIRKPLKTPIREKYLRNGLFLFFAADNLDIFLFFFFDIFMLYRDPESNATSRGRCRQEKNGLRWKQIKLPFWTIAKRLWVALTFECSCAHSCSPARRIATAGHMFPLAESLAEASRRHDGRRTAASHAAVSPWFFSRPERSGGFSPSSWRGWGAGMKAETARVLGTCRQPSVLAPGGLGTPTPRRAERRARSHRCPRTRRHAPSGAGQSREPPRRRARLRVLRRFIS